MWGKKIEQVYTCQKNILNDPINGWYLEEVRELEAKWYKKEKAMFNWTEANKVTTSVCRYKERSRTNKMFDENGNNG